MTTHKGSAAWKGRGAFKSQKKSGEGVFKLGGVWVGENRGYIDCQKHPFHMQMTCLSVEMRIKIKDQVRFCLGPNLGGG